MIFVFVFVRVSFDGMDAALRRNEEKTRRLIEGYHICTGIRLKENLDTVSGSVARPLLAPGMPIKALVRL
jgi:hypothetical protein